MVKLHTTRDGVLRPARHRALQPLPILWLVLLWCTLWGSFSPMIVAGGVVAAVVVCVVFPLPPLAVDVRIRPARALWLLLGFLVDVVRASLQVTGIVLRRRPVRNAVIGVDLTSSSDFVLTGVASMLSLVPGSVVVEVRRSTHTLFLHVLDVPDQAAAEQFRAEALAVEQRFLAAFAPKDPVEAGAAPHAPGADR